MRYWTLAAVVASAACSTEDTLRLGGPGTATPTPTPTATPTPTPFVGRGLDGALTETATDVTPNTCEELVSLSGTTLEIGANAGEFAADRYVLLHQMTDDLVTNSGDQTPITTSDAGRWELAFVTGVSMTTLTLSAPPAQSFRTTGAVGARAQACTFPEYTDVTISGNGQISALSYGGSAVGGIIAFAASGTVTASLGTQYAVISGAARGFGGGAPSTSSTATSIIAIDTPSTEGGRKGEGIDGRLGLSGRGNLANSGGGGNGYKAGGGGGGNGGAGGSGGKQRLLDGDEPLTAGIGGAAIALPLPGRITLGGGGGGGHQNSANGGAGGTGGGAILIFANRLEGDGRISVNGGTGGDAGNAAGGDGAGGGGGGGTIVIYALSHGFTGEILASGQPGGDVIANTSSTIFGPGGGGGGGRIYFSLVTGTADTIGFSVGGQSNGNNVTGGSAHGATDGADGVLVLDDALPTN